MKMQTSTRLVMLGLVLAALAPATGRAQAPERFGTVDFPNSCAPARASEPSETCSPRTRRARSRPGASRRFS